MNTTTFKLLSGGDNACAGGRCPSVYVGSDGFAYIKGVIVDPQTRSALDVDPNEDVVRIPLDVLNGAKLDSST